MKHLLLISIAVCTAFLSLISSSYAETAPSSFSVTGEKQLLQEGLTVYEINREVKKLGIKNKQLTVQIHQTNTALTAQQVKMEQLRKQAASVLKAYYMGERNTVLLTLFSAHSLSDALDLYQYIRMLFLNDKSTLQTAANASHKLTQLKSQLTEEQQQIQQVTTAFIQQKQQLEASKKQLEHHIQASGNASKARSDIATLNKEWDEKGLPLFKSYLDMLAAAMSKLPSMLQDGNNNYLTKTDSHFVFQMTDQQLNTFLKKQNQKFNHISIGFTDQNRIELHGVDQGESLTVTGHYSVVNKPQNELVFHIDSLTFNGFSLPGTTIQSLENQIDLSISPSSLSPLIRATGVQIKDHRLIIDLQLSL